AGVAIERARRGDGPSFVEAVSVRNRGHFTGDLEPYRPLDRQLADPIQIAAARLVATGAAQAELDRINADAAAEMEAALADAKAAPLPGRDRLLAGVWA
ncbi:MAG TPA: thiamine pyrophosphate-dependent enzyme, partial [Ilumatobacteraceae bacterium]|nr:thiamine pyrophosphate-dependent enzyme [Ilumatobacteraceae bacterium]